MEKKTLLSIIMVLLMVFNISAQETIGDTQELLNRLSGLPNSHGVDISSLFTPTERAQLQSHFLDLTPQSSFRAPGDVYSVQTRNTCGEKYGQFPVAGPYDVNLIVATATSVFGGDFGQDDVLYGNDATTNSIITIDKETGVETILAPFANFPADQFLTGISWNSVNNTMYAISIGNLESYLYSLEVATATFTLIGAVGVEEGIWIEINEEGRAFMADVNTDMLYELDLSTGAATAIGALGLDINFGQDADFDKTTGVLYSAAYLGSGVNLFGTINLETGEFSALGTVDSDCAQLGMVVLEPTFLSVEDNLKDQIQIFPNPSENVINVKLPASLTLIDVNLFDVLGQDTGVELENGMIDISSLSQGVYLLTVNTDAGSRITRIIKE